jgi:hypothetical protein
VDDLKDRSTHFRTQWDMFRLVFGRDLPPFGADMMADGYDRDGTPYIRTLQGERVKSLEECVIADWLFYNGVAYDYERRYEFDTATDTHRQYRPDFYYPDARLYHEHFALDADGQPPKHFANYAKGCTGSASSMRRAAPPWSRPPRLACAVDMPCRILRSGLARLVSNSTRTPTASCPIRAPSRCRTRT